MTGHWRKSTSLPTSQSTKRVILVVSDGHISVFPPVQTRAHKLRHVFQRILVCHRASQQHQDGRLRLSEKQKVQLHLWVTSLCLASPQCGSSVPRAAMQMGHQLRDGKCSGSYGVTSSSVGSLGPRFNRGARSSIGKSGSCFFLSWSAGSKATVFCFRDQ